MRWSSGLAIAVALLGCGGDGTSSTSVDDDGCDGAKLRAVPRDPAMRGPWAVGARTVTIGGLRTEIWYPAPPGSDATPARYDIRTALPASEAAKIPDADNPWQDCDCARELPLDDAYGPYPVVLFVHGTAAFRHQSLPIVTHWASRGFVVVAADHPGLYLGDFITQACGGQPPPQNLSADLDTVIAALGTPTGELGFLAGHIDTARIAVAGHSAGGAAAAAAAIKPGVRVVAVMAGVRATAASPTLESTLYLGGLDDGIASFGQVSTAWTGSPSPRRLFGIEHGGHLMFSDLCETKNPRGQDLLQIASEHQVCGAQLAGFLFDCDPAHLDGPTAWGIVDYATTAVFEPVLQCRGTTDPSEIRGAYPAVTDYREAL